MNKQLLFYIGLNFGLGIGISLASSNLIGALPNILFGVLLTIAFIFTKNTK